MGPVACGHGTRPGNTCECGSVERLGAAPGAQRLLAVERDAQRLVVAAVDGASLGADLDVVLGALPHHAAVGVGLADDGYDGHDGCQEEREAPEDGHPESVVEALDAGSTGGGVHCDHLDH